MKIWNNKADILHNNEAVLISPNTVVYILISPPRSESGVDLLEGSVILR